MPEFYRNPSGRGVIIVQDDGTVMESNAPTPAGANIQPYEALQRSPLAVGPGPDFDPRDIGQAEAARSTGFAPSEPARPPVQPTRRQPAPRQQAPIPADGPFDPRSPFERDIAGLPAAAGRTLLDAIPGGAAIRMGMGQIAPYFQRPAPPAPPPPPPRDQSFPIPPQPTVEEMMEAEGFPSTPPSPEPLSLEQLRAAAPIPLIEEGQIPIDPTLEPAAERAREREARMNERFGRREARIQEDIDRIEGVPRWVRGLEVLGAGLGAFGTGRAGAAGNEALQRPRQQLAELENQLMQIGLSREDVIAAREEAEAAPIRAKHQVDVQRILTNHNIGVQDAQQARELVIDAQRRGDERAFQVYSQRLQIALERLKTNLAQIYRAGNVMAGLGGQPAAESILADVASRGEGAQAQVSDRLARANLQGLLESDIAISGGNAGRAVSITRRRVQDMFARMGLPAPEINRRILSNPSAFAEYLIRASNGRILQDPEVQRFEYIPGIQAGD